MVNVWFPPNIMMALVLQYFVCVTHLDDFSSSVSHGQRTGVETRGGREDVQLAHLIHTTGTHIHVFSQFLMWDKKKTKSAVY